MRRLALAFLLLPAVAWANCARDVDDATPQVPRIADAAARARAVDYLARARRELAENEEFDCQSAIVVVQKIVAGAMPKAVGR